jgi:hypothetical protein
MKWILGMIVLFIIPSLLGWSGLTPEPYIPFGRWDLYQLGLIAYGYGGFFGIIVYAGFKQA